MGEVPSSICHRRIICAGVFRYFLASSTTVGCERGSCTPSFEAFAPYRLTRQWETTLGDDPVLIIGRSKFGLIEERMQFHLIHRRYMSGLLTSLSRSLALKLHTPIARARPSERSFIAAL